MFGMLLLRTVPRDHRIQYTEQGTVIHACIFAMVNQLSVIGLTKRPWRTDNCLTEKDFGQEGVHDDARFFFSSKNDPRSDSELMPNRHINSVS